MRLTTLLLLFSIAALGDACISTGSGSTTTIESLVRFIWSDPANWSSCSTSGAHAPGLNDTFTITHRMVVTGPGVTTVGDGTQSGLINPGGSILNLQGSTFRQRGNIQHANPVAKTFVIDNYGGRWEFDPTGSSDPPNALIRIIPTTNTQPNAIIRSRKGPTGTCLIGRTVDTSTGCAVITTYRPLGTEANGYFTVTNVRVGLFDFQDTDFLYLGSATRSMAITIDNSSLDSPLVTLKNNVFDHCGMLDIGNIAWAGSNDIIIEDNRWQNSYASAININASTPVSGTPTRTFIGNYLDRGFTTGYFSGFTIRANVIPNYFEPLTGDHNFTFDSNLSYKTIQQATYLKGATYKDFFFVDNTNLHNPQGYVVNGSLNQTIDGFIGQLVIPDEYIALGVADIEMLIGGWDTPGFTLTVTNAITLPATFRDATRADIASGPLLVADTASGYKDHRYTHITAKGTTKAAVMAPIWFAHSSTTCQTGIVTIYKYNLYHDSPTRVLATRSAHVALSANCPSILDQLTPAGADYNASLNAGPGLQRSRLRPLHRLLRLHHRHGSPRPHRHRTFLRRPYPQL